MVSLIKKAKQWPRGETGQPIFKTTQEAIFYANLIHNIDVLVDEIDLCRRVTRRELRILRQKPDPDLDILYEYAVKAQLFRECLDEAKRIKNES